MDTVKDAKETAGPTRSREECGDTSPATGNRRGFQARLEQQFRKKIKNRLQKGRNLRKIVQPVYRQGLRGTVFLIMGLTITVNLQV